MTIFSLQRDEIFSRLSESKPLHIHKTQTHNTSYVVQLFSLSLFLSSSCLFTSVPFRNNTRRERFFQALVDKTSSSSEVSLSFSLLHCLCFFLLKCIFHSSCLRLLFCSLLFFGFVRLNFTVWLLIRSFWGLDLT